jgi:pyruvate/2-oxoglutarate dehydrogenase complex dihydrolipoamide dehydrogenase (E3) component
VVAESVDAVVLGMGPGGEEVAGRLASSGLEVVGVEGRLLGGECPYWGCVPSKMMLRAAGVVAEVRRAPELAGKASIDPDWSIVARRVREATDDWDDTVAVERFESKGGRFVRGWGRLDGPRRVVAGGVEFEARRAVVIATGTQPWAPPVPGLEETGFWTNRDAIETEHVPRSLLVLGAGAVGVELAQVFTRFGSEVTVVEMAPHILPPEEPESAALLDEVLRGEGVRIVTAAEVTGARRDHSGFWLQVRDESIGPCEQLLVAAGRRADLAALGLASIGLDGSARFVSTDDRMRAGPDTWAVGDVTGVGAFTHVSMYQARIAASDILGQEVEAAEYRALPRVTFTDPEVGSVGLTESVARDAGHMVRVGLAPLQESARGWIHKAGNAGLIKLVEDSETGVLLGATSVGPCGGEVLGLLQLAVQCQVRTKELEQLIFAYPTFTRAIEAALANLRPNQS